MPSVIGGGETGNSWLAPLAKETKQIPEKKPNQIANFLWFILF
jgi:hypothetical protein